MDIVGPSLGRQHDEDAPTDLTIGTPSPSPLPVTQAACYTSGCGELDGRVLGSRFVGGSDGLDGLTGGLVGISAEGDAGLVLALQVAVRHLRRDATATVRLVTTHPVTHVVRLLKGILKGVQKSTVSTTATTGAEATRLAGPARAALLSRVLISRIYAPGDLEAVLSELEAVVPFQRLWSTVAAVPVPAADNLGWQDVLAEPPVEAKRNTARPGGGPVHVPSVPFASSTSDSSASSPPDILILTEVDHHFKWMRLQGHDGRLHELYGQLMRRLRALTARCPLPRTPATPQQPLVFVLNSTIARRRPEGDLGPGHDDEDSGPVAISPGLEPDMAYQLALAALQQQRHVGQPRAFQLCCRELARAQCIEPLYGSVMNYFCGLHICLTRLPPALVDMWGGDEGGSRGNSSNLTESSLWVAHVESDEAEISHRSANRFGVIHLARGMLQDATYL